MSSERQLQVGVIDGVRTLWIEQPGPVNLRLIFGVGMGFETLPSRGITHFVEHVALSWLTSTRLHESNGSTGYSTTTFDTRSDPAGATDFLRRVCDSLQALPAGEVEMQRRIIRAEAAARGGPSAFQAIDSYRFGTAGPALSFFPEYGLDWLDHAALQQWANQCFTSDNAVLVIEGPMPPGLTVPLPRGVAAGQPPAPAVALSRPSRVGDRGGAVGLNMLLERCPADMVATYVLHARLFDRLRTQRGLTYSVIPSRTPISLDRVALTMVADVVAETAREVTQLVADTAVELAGAAPSEAEVADGIRNAVRSLEDGEPAYLQLSWHLARALGAMPDVPLETTSALTAAVTPEQVRRVLANGLKTAILMHPADAQFSHPVFTEYPYPDRSRLPGKEFLSQDPWCQSGGSRPRLIVGHEGFTVVANGTAFTVRYRSVALVRHLPRIRTVCTTEGYEITVCAEDWCDGDVALATIDRGLPKDRYVAVPTKTEEPVDPVVAAPPILIGSF